MNWGLSYLICSMGTLDQMITYVASEKYRTPSRHQVLRAVRASTSERKYEGTHLYNLGNAVRRI